MTSHRHDVIVSIQGCRLSNGPDGRRFVDMTIDGLMTSHLQGYTVSYRDPESEGTTVLLIEDNRVTMLRSGERNEQMVLEKGRRYVSYVDTAEGSQTFGVTASHVAAELDENGGRIEMVYGVEADDGITEENHMQIDIRAASGAWPAAPEGITVYKDMYIN